MIMAKYTYFISGKYKLENNGIPLAFNEQFSANEPIRSMECIKEIESKLKEKWRVQYVHIMNFQQFYRGD